MRKILVSAAALTLGVVSCQTSNIESEPSISNTKKITISASIGNNATKANIDNSWIASWDANEKLGGWSSDAPATNFVEFAAQNTKGDVKAEFVGTPAGESLRLIYPYNSESGVIGSDGVYSVDVSEQLVDVAVGSNVGLGDAIYMVSDEMSVLAGTEIADFTLYQLGAVLNLELSFSDLATSANVTSILVANDDLAISGKLNLSSDDIDGMYTDATTADEIDITVAGLKVENNAKYYVPVSIFPFIAANDNSIDVTVNYTLSDGTRCQNLVTLNLSANASIQRAKYYTLPVAVNASEAILNPKADNYLDYISDSYLSSDIADQCDMDNDGVVTYEESLNLLSVDADYYVSSIKGIEYFENLENLTINNKYSSEFKNLVIRNRKLKYVDISMCSALESLNLSDCSELEVLLLSSNSKLTSFDFSPFKALKEVYTMSNKFSEIDFTKNTELVSINASGDNFSEIDVTKNTKAKKIYISNGKLSQIDLQYNTEVENLNLSYCSGLSSLDLSHNTKITELDLQYGSLDEYDISMLKDLRTLKLDNCANLSRVDVSNNMSLTTFTMTGCYYVDPIIMRKGQYIPNQSGVSSYYIDYVDAIVPDDCVATVTDDVLKNYILDNFDTDSDGVISVAEAEAVTEIVMSGNEQIKEFNGFDYFPNIFKIELAECNLEVLNIDFQNNLTVLKVNNNPNLKSINFDRVKTLEYLDVSYTALTSIANMGNQSKLIEANISNCQISGDVKFEYLYELVKLDVSNNKIQGNKFVFPSCDKLQYLDASNNEITFVNLWSCPLLEDVNFDNNQLFMLSELTYLTVLKNLSCSNNVKLSSLDLSKTTVLESLTAAGCTNLATVNIGDNTDAVINVPSTTEVISGTSEM